jgi:hypothetical protein
VKDNVIMGENAIGSKGSLLQRAEDAEAPLTFNTSVYKSTLMNY